MSKCRRPERRARDDRAPDGADVKIGEVLGTIEEGAGRLRAAATAPAPDGAAPAERQRPTCRRRPRRARRRASRTSTWPAVKADGPRVTKARRRASADRCSVPTAAPRPRRQPANPSPEPQASARPPPAPRPACVRRSHANERVRMSKRRATIAQRLVEAQQTAAMLTTFNEVDMTAVMALRERQKEAFKTKLRRRPRHRVVLRQGRRSPRCGSFRASTPRSRATRWS